MEKKQKGRPHILSDNMRQTIIELYQTGRYTQKELGKFFDVSDGCVGVLLRQNKIPTNPDSDRVYKLENRDFFDVIDTQEKAYFLGLMFADGYNFEARNRFHIQLQERDKLLLEKFNQFLGSDRPLQFRVQETERHQNQYGLYICSKQMSDALARLGCVQAKSLILKFPTSDQVPDHLVRHFIRGYFDGDGCFYSGEKLVAGKIYPRQAISIVSTNVFCEKLQSILLEQLNIYCTVKVNHPKSDNKITTRLGFEKANAVYDFLDWIYKDATIFLDRKYQHYLEEKTKYAAKGGRWAHKISRLQKESV